jgi:YHS domain-containing protein
MWQPPSRYADDRSTTAGPAAGQAPAWQPPAYAGQGNQFARDERGFAAPQPGYPNTPLTSSPRPEAQRPTSNVPLALDGYCPVTLAEQEKWEKGDVRWGVEHRGRLYLFQSPQYQQQFLADPDRFSPVLSGYDPTRYIDFGEMVPGRRRHGMWFRGKIYLFTDESSLDRFSQNPEYYAQRTHEIMMAAGR